MRVAFVICMALLTADLAGAQWRGTERLDGSGQGFVIDMKVSGNNHYVLFDTFLNSQWTTYLAVSRDGGRTPWQRYETSFRNWARFDAQGDVVVIAECEHGTGGGHGGGGPQPDHFWVEVSHDAGQSYLVQEMNTPSLFDLWSYPAVKIDGDRVYLHWSEDNNVKYLQVSNDKGATWLATPKVIPHRLVHEMLEVKGDHLFGLRIEELGDGDELVFQRSLDSGTTWTTMRIDNADVHGITEAVLTMDSGRLSALWREFYAWNKVDLLFATSSDNGTTWSRPMRVNESVPAKSAVVKSFDLAASGETLVMAYAQQGVNGMNAADIYARFSQDGGATWDASVRVNPASSPIGLPMQLPHCVVNGQRAVVTWIDTAAFHHDDKLTTAVTRDGGATWSVSYIEPGFVWEGTEYALANDSEGAVGIAFEKTGAHVYANALHQPDLSAQNDLSPGSLFSMTLSSVEALEEGHVGLVLLSATGSGSATGGIPIPPPWANRVLPLDYDVLTQLGLTAFIPVLLTGPMAGGSASTPAFTVPPGVALGDVWAAAVVLKPGGGFGTMTDTLKIN